MRDAGYRGVVKREENLGREVDWQVAMRPGQRRKLDPGSGEALAERNQASKQGIDTVEGGASLPESKAGVRLRQGALPGPDEEHATTGDAFGTGQPADGRGPPRRVTGEQWAEVLPRTAAGTDQGPQRLRWEPNPSEKPAPSNSAGSCPVIQRFSNLPDPAISGRGSQGAPGVLPSRAGFRRVPVPAPGG